MSWLIHFFISFLCHTFFHLYVYLVSNADHFQFHNYSTHTITTLASNTVVVTSESFRKETSCISTGPEKNVCHNNSYSMKARPTKIQLKPNPFLHVQIHQLPFCCSVRVFLGTLNTHPKFINHSVVHHTAVYKPAIDAQHS